MTVLDHLDELRTRLLRVAIVYVVAFVGCWVGSEPLLELALRPIRETMFEGGRIVFTELTEPFLIYMKVAALAAVFVAAPFALHQFWGFVAPGLHRRERRLALPFLALSTVFFTAGGWFGYAVVLPYAAGFLLSLGGSYQAMLTLRSAFAFESRLILAMGVIFELPIVILFLSRLGIVTPGLLLRHFRLAVLVIAMIAAIVTPTPDVVTMSILGGPMILLYLLGVAMAWLAARRESS